MFKVKRNPVETLWVPLDTTSTPTLYDGQLVKSTGDGVGALAVASGIADTSGLQVIAGVVIGTNNRTPVYDTTYQTNSIASVITQAAQSARDWTGQEGQWSKGDPQSMVQIHRIDAHTVLEAPLYLSSTLMTVPTLLTVTTGSTDGLGFTSNACGFTPVADLCTSYCRSGANGGIMRISDDTSTTVETNDVAFPNDIAVGDTFVRVPLRPFGQSYVQLNGTTAVGLWFDVSASPATNYFIIDVLELDLRVAGQEKVLFTFHPCHFDKVRA